MQAVLVGCSGTEIFLSALDASGSVTPPVVAVPPIVIVPDEHRGSGHSKEQSVGPGLGPQQTSAGRRGWSGHAWPGVHVGRGTSTKGPAELYPSPLMGAPVAATAIATVVAAAAGRPGSKVSGGQAGEVGSWKQGRRVQQELSCVGGENAGKQDELQAAAERALQVQRAGQGAAGAHRS